MQKILRLFLLLIGVMAFSPYVKAEADGEYYPEDGMGVLRPYKVIDGIRYDLCSGEYLGNGVYSWYLLAQMSEPSAAPENLVIPSTVFFRGMPESDQPEEYWQYRGEYPVTTINLQDNFSTGGYQHFSNIKTIYIPEKANDVFLALRNLEYITVDSNNSYYSSANGLLLDKSGSTLIAIPFKMGTAVVPDGVVTLGQNDINSSLVAGANYLIVEDIPTLHTVELPGTVKVINSTAFANCANLTVINLPESLIEIRKSAFMGCTSLSEISLPSSLLRIEDEIFAYTHLQTIYIPERVEEISQKAFAYCDNMTEINVSEDNPYYKSYGGALYDKSMETLLCIPSGFEDIFTIPESTTKIGDYAFYDPASVPESIFTAKIQGIIFHDGIKEIGDYAFYGNWVSIKLSELKLPAELEKLGKQSLTLFGVNTIILPNSLTDIGEMPFNSRPQQTLIAPFEDPIELKFDILKPYANQKLIVPPGCVEKYKAAIRWNQFSTISTFTLGQPLHRKLDTDMAYQNWLVTATDAPVIGEWTSTDESVAYANDSHLFVAAGNPGSCSLTFTSEGYSESCGVTVTEADSQANEREQNMQQNDEHRVVIDGLSADGKMLNVHLEPRGIYEHLSWVSSNEKVATINHGIIDFIKNDPVSFTVEIANGGNSDTIDLSGFSDMSEIVVSEENAPCEYFNLQGCRVSEPDHGIFIMKSGEKVVKIVR